MQSFRWGIMGTGGIAHNMARTLTTMPYVELNAVGSRSITSAKKFAIPYNISHPYASYEELVNSPHVDIIYVATPHSRHYVDVKLALEAGKHVLCEKAFTLNAYEASELVKLAREKNLFLMEAMWTRFIPAIVQVRRLLADNVIGDIHMVRAHFDAFREFDANHRLFNLELGGGVLLDLGIYPLSFAHMILGEPDRVSGEAYIGETGADFSASLLLGYEKAQALVSCSLIAPNPVNAIVVGTEGYIQVHPPFPQTQHLSLKVKSNDPQVMHIPFEGTGFGYQVAEVHACLRAGKTESDIMPLDETVAIMAIMDKMRAQWGIVYPTEHLPPV